MSDVIIVQRMRHTAGLRKAFTLIELLVVIAIVALLIGMLMPSLRKVKDQTKLVICTSNLRNVGTAIHAYAYDFDDTIPFGPKGLPMAGGQFYTVTGNVTSLISLYNGHPVGLGLLLDSYLADQPKVLFCPGTDQPSNAEVELSRVGQFQSQSDYYYRHASVALLSGQPKELHIRLSRLGKNRNKSNISALVMDVQFLVHPNLSGWGINTRTAHQQKSVNILLADGQVITADNKVGQYTIDSQTSLHESLEKILQVFEKADELR